MTEWRMLGVLIILAGLAMAFSFRVWLRMPVRDNRSEYVMTFLMILLGVAVAW